MRRRDVALNMANRAARSGSFPLFRLAARAQIEPDRRVLESQMLLQLVHQISFVALHHRIRGIDEKGQPRRPSAALGAVEKFYRLAARERRAVSADDFLQGLVDRRC